jgi:hypothetical protein
MASAARELLAARSEVWGFLAEPYHLSDWWPGVVGVEPDRRGFAVGARWRIVRRAPRGLLRLPERSWQGRAHSEKLVIDEISPGARWAWRLVGQSGGGRIAGGMHATVEL